jgi:radical SAM protein with 4Fe4S-binding SPASM domain
MLMRRHSSDYNFVGDTETGVTMRWGSSLDRDPVLAPWPELADISISNHCSKHCDFCYRDSVPDNSFISIQDYERILDSLTSPRWRSVFQVALGGGEPLEHPGFLEIIRRTWDRGIVANFTTNGLAITKTLAAGIAGKVGAVAISVSNMEELRLDRVKILAGAGIKTNLHFILDSDSIDQATEVLEGRFNHLLDDVNAVIFLTFKPKGRGTESRCLKAGASLDRFVARVDSSGCSTHIGFDACFVPILMHRTEVDVDYVDSCECAFFSVYIDEQMNVKPCSFATGNHDSFSLRQYSMDEIWTRCFADYRRRQLDFPCQQDCAHSSSCHGKCAYFGSLAFCYQPERIELIGEA